jgi:2-succinyl-5-enolpyruvyl-6-hydroxy-3-cyclohexene-1-carboxylate synthase
MLQDLFQFSCYQMQDREKSASKLFNKCRTVFLSNSSTVRDARAAEEQYERIEVFHNETLEFPVF